MAYDRSLAERVRAVLGSEPDVTETVMFGGMAFLVGGVLAVTVSGQGGLMVRCPPGRSEQLVTTEGVARVVMRGRELDGWLRVGADAVDAEPALRRWVTTGRDAARDVPAR